MAQFVTRVEETLASEIDRMVDDGVVASRSAAVRLGLEGLVERHCRQKIGQAMEQAPIFTTTIRSRQLFHNARWSLIQLA